MQNNTWNEDLRIPVETCQELGVVGIDVAGSAKGADEKYEDSVVEVFQVWKFFITMFRLEIIEFNRPFFDASH